MYILYTNTFKSLYLYTKIYFFFMSENTTNSFNGNIKTPSLTPSAAKRKRGFGYWLKYAFRVVFYAHILFILVIAFITILYINHNPPYTVLMLYRQGKAAQTPSHLPLRETSGTFQLDLINLEDGQFRKHYGIDTEAIKEAKRKNDKLGYRAYGGSTITQQLARTLFLIPQKSYFRKYLELLITFELELILQKDRILELYINYAELGDGVYGFNDAALHYYKKSFVKTTTDEKIRLMTILASPINYNPTTFKENSALAGRYKFIYKWHKYHL
jgi:monofunctional biosynthetic peptidoglycan transglycosylase